MTWKLKTASSRRKHTHTDQRLKPHEVKRKRHSNTTGGKSFCTMNTVKDEENSNATASLKSPPGKLPILSCPGCGKIFSSKENLNFHNKVPCQDIKRRYKCKVCGNTCSAQGILVKHIKQFHPNEKPKKCPHYMYCGKKFWLDEMLNRHLKHDHHPKNNVQDKMFTNSMPSGPKSLISAMACNQHGKTHGGKTHGDKSNLARHTQKKTFKYYKCSYCAQRFSELSKLISHMRSAHSTKEPLQCLMCDKTFWTDDMMDLHMKTHPTKKVEVKSYKCRFCGIMHSQTQTLMSHIKRFHSDEKPKECPFYKYCGRKFWLDEILNSHLNKDHHNEMYNSLASEKLPTGKSLNDDTTYNQRSKTFEIDRKSNIARSMPKQDNINSYKCRYCVQRFVQRSHLKAHIGSAHANKEPLQCHECKKTFVMDDTMKRHMKTHLINNMDRIYKGNAQQLACDEVTTKVTQPRILSSDNRLCDRCGEISDLRYDIDTKRHECQECMKECIETQNPNSEIQDLAGENDGVVNDVNGDLGYDVSDDVIIVDDDVNNVSDIYKCRSCANRYLTMDPLVKHIELNHRNEGLMICPFYNKCGKIFLSNELLDMNKHMEEHYTIQNEQISHFISMGKSTQGKSPLEDITCYRCNKILSSRQSLARHLRYHDNIKPFKCRFCGKACVETATLYSHIKLRHPNEKPVKCPFYPECGKTFWLDELLANHMQVSHKHDKANTQKSKPEDTVTSDKEEVLFNNEKCDGNMATEIQEAVYVGSDESLSQTQDHDTTITITDNAENPPVIIANVPFEIEHTCTDFTIGSENAQNASEANIISILPFDSEHDLQVVEMDCDSLEDNSDPVIHNILPIPEHQNQCEDELSEWPYISEGAIKTEDNKLIPLAVLPEFVNP